MGYIIAWIVCGLIGLAISSSKKAGEVRVMPGDIIGALLFGPFLLLISIIMPREASCDADKSDRIIAGDDDALDQDHFKVLQHLAQSGQYNPERDPPIVWDKYRTKRVLADLTSLPQPLANCSEGTYTISQKGAETCRLAAFIEHLKRGGNPGNFDEK